MFKLGLLFHILFQFLQEKYFLIKVLIYPEVFFPIKSHYLLHAEFLCLCQWVRDRERETEGEKYVIWEPSCIAAMLLLCLDALFWDRLFLQGFPATGPPYAFLPLCRAPVLAGCWLFCFSIAILSSMAFGHRKVHMGFGFLYLNFSNTFYNRK